MIILIITIIIITPNYCNSNVFLRNYETNTTTKNYLTTNIIYTDIKVYAYNT